MPDLAERACLAQAEALAAQGKLREPFGGAIAAPRDLVLMAAGFEANGVNSGDVVGPDPDVDAARAFFTEHGASWGLRVPIGLPSPGGRLLLRRRLMALPREAFRPAPEAPAGLALRRAGPDDLPDVLHIDSTAFGLDRVENEQWLRPLLTGDPIVSALATLDGEAVGTAYTLRTDAAAGACLYVAGVAVLPHARRRGVGSAMSTWLLEQGFAAGAELAHLNPDTDAAARLYERLGFAETPGHDIYVDV